jgi:hypothetical protein
MAITKVSRGLLSTGISDSSDATAITIDSSENVGIGTTSPDGKLDVRGTIFVNGDGTGGRIFASSGNLSLSDGNGRQILRIDDPGSGNSHSHIFDSNGRLGVGTTSPDNTLHVDASGGGTIKLTRESVSTANFLRLECDGANGSIVSKQATIFNNGDAERMRILSTGGLTFNGDTATANALDDYEEGTWTATLAFGGNSVGLTYSVRTGYYMKVGRIVTATLYVLLTDKGSSTGQLILSGLPYTALGSNAYAAASLHLNLVSFSGFPQAYVVNGSTLAYFGQTADSGTFTQLTNSNISNTTGIIFTVTYQTA